MLYVLVETDAGTTASTGLSKKAKARTAKEDCHRQKAFTPVDRGIMGVLLTGQHSCGILTRRIRVDFVQGLLSLGRVRVV